MAKNILSQEQIARLVLANKYKVDPETKFVSRCIDGRYPTEKGLPALAIPGADAGEMAVILATANVYGLDLDEQKAFNTLTEVVGGVKNLRFHTDTHAEKGIVCAGCGHMKQMKTDPKAFNLEAKDVEFILEKAKNVRSEGAVEVVLQGDHQEGAVITIKGDYGVYPQWTSDAGDLFQTFVFHQSLVDERHHEIARKLISDKAVKGLKEDEDEYLYSILSETTENHLFEIASRLAVGLPMYSVTFTTEGEFDILAL